MLLATPYHSSPIDAVGSPSRRQSSIQSPSATSRGPGGCRPVYLAAALLLATAGLPLCVSGHASSAGLTFELPDNEKMCFQEDFEGSRPYRLEYRVIEGGNYDVDVSLESAGGKHVYKATRKEKDTVTFETSWGTYTLCFSNEFSTITHKKVYFNLRPDELDQLAAESGKQGPGVLTLLEAAMETVHEMCTSVMHAQTEYRLNEARGRHAAERLNVHVQRWSVAQSVFILLAGGGQVLILRRFFTDRREQALLRPGTEVVVPGGLMQGGSSSSINMPPIRA